MENNQLALHGGPKAITMDPEQAASLLKWPKYAPGVYERLAEQIKNGEITFNIDVVFELGDQFADYIGTEYCLPMSRGTSALYIAYQILGVGFGTEVICPTYTHWATAMPAANLGAKLVFVESDPETFNMDPEDLRKKITPRTKLIVPVHIWGLPCEMDAINEVAQEHNIPVCEDASHAHGAVYQNKKVGTFSDISVFSIQNSKLLPAGEGGLLLTDKDEYFEEACARTDYLLLKRGFGGKWAKYKNTGMGWNFRVSTLNAAIAIEQLKVLDQTNAVMVKNCERFNNFLEQTGYFKIYHPPAHTKRVYYGNLVYYDNEASGIPAEDLIKALQAEGCSVAFTRYPLLHQQTFFTERGHDPTGLPVTGDLLNHLIHVPSFPSDNDDLVDQYVVAFEKVLGVLAR